MPKGNPASALSRILGNSDMTGDCWVWLGAVYRSGYGQITEYVDGVPRKLTVHRHVYEQVVGPIRTETLDHLCSNKRCFNPDHLEPVSRIINTQRGEANNSYLARRRAATTCKAGHEYTEENTYMTNRKGRVCRQCALRYSREYRERKRALQA